MRFKQRARESGSLPMACELLGLSRNPFRERDGPSGIHVPQAADGRWEALIRGSLDGRTTPPVVLHGEPGIGLTHRLVRAEALVLAQGSFCARLSLAGLRPEGLVPRLAAALLAGCQLGDLEGALAAPRWYRELIPIARRTSQRTLGRDDAAAITRALEANAPCLLMVDDLDSLPGTRSAEAFLQVLEDVRMRAGPGVLLAWTCHREGQARLEARFPALHEAARQLEILPLTDGQAVALLKARLGAVRMVDAVDGLFPFTTGAVAQLNRAAAGNPRRLLRLANGVLESCAGQGAYEMDDRRMAAALAPLPQV